MGLRTQVEGREKIPAGTVLFLANHTSFIDPVPIVHALPKRVAILAKASLFKIPVVGWAFRLAGFVPVNRSDRESAIESVELAAERIKAGTSFLAYPEGTRSYDGRLLPFKRGVFVMAIRSGVPIVPMVAIGVNRLMPKGTWKIKPGHVLVRFGEPIKRRVIHSKSARCSWIASAQRCPRYCLRTNNRWTSGCRRRNAANEDA